MRHLIRLTDYKENEIKDIFEIADDVQNCKYANILNEKTVIMFFPNTSIRTRVTFEKRMFKFSNLKCEYIWYEMDTF
jgi:ornithine carbamoyltransferase